LIPATPAIAKRALVRARTMSGGNIIKKIAINYKTNCN
jgi:hypothetical protein